MVEDVAFLNDQINFDYNSNKINKASTQLFLKRVVDILFSALALVSALPLIVIIYALVRQRDGTPIVYRHRRVGRDGKYFYCLKFRTMVKNGDELLARLLDESPDAQREWETHRKLRDDPRVLRGIGKFLRKTSLDELPQLVNVLRGEMSLVGPRPVTEEELVHYGGEVNKYFSARPGLTGPWQISGRSDTSFQTRVQLDLEYLGNLSLWRDITILARTVFTVLAGRGAY